MSHTNGLTQRTGEELRAAKQAHRNQMVEIAELCTPVGIDIVYHGRLSGRYYYLTHQMVVPKPVTRKALQIYLHEVAHVVLDHEHRRRKMLSHEVELEAEQWSMMIMRAFGVAVPRASRERAKAYVARKIVQGRKRGGRRTNPTALRFAGRTRVEEASR